MAKSHELKLRRALVVALGFLGTKAGILIPLGLIFFICEMMELGSEVP